MILFRVHPEDFERFSQEMADWGVGPGDLRMSFDRDNHVVVVIDNPEIAAMLKLKYNQPEVR